MSRTTSEEGHSDENEDETFFNPFFKKVGIQCCEFIVGLVFHGNSEEFDERRIFSPEYKYTLVLGWENLQFYYSFRERGTYGSETKQVNLDHLSKCKLGNNSKINKVIRFVVRDLISEFKFRHYEDLRKFVYTFKTVRKAMTVMKKEEIGGRRFFQSRFPDQLVFLSPVHKVLDIEDSIHALTTEAITSFLKSYLVPKFDSKTNRLMTIYELLERERYLTKVMKFIGSEGVERLIWDLKRKEIEPNSEFFYGHDLQVMLEKEQLRVSLLRAFQFFRMNGYKTPDEKSTKNCHTIIQNYFSKACSQIMIPKKKKKKEKFSDDVTIALASKVINYFTVHHRELWDPESCFQDVLCHLILGISWEKFSKWIAQEINEKFRRNQRSSMSIKLDFFDDGSAEEEDEDEIEEKKRRRKKMKEEEEVLQLELELELEEEEEEEEEIGITVTKTKKKKYRYRNNTTKKQKYSSTNEDDEKSPELKTYTETVNKFNLMSGDEFQFEFLSWEVYRKIKYLEIQRKRLLVDKRLNEIRKEFKYDILESIVERGLDNESENPLDVVLLRFGVINSELIKEPYIVNNCANFGENYLKYLDQKIKKFETNDLDELKKKFLLCLERKFELAKLIGNGYVEFLKEAGTLKMLWNTQVSSVDPYISSFQRLVSEFQDDLFSKNLEDFDEKLIRQSQADSNRKERIYLSSIVFEKNLCLEFDIQGFVRVRSPSQFYREGRRGRVFLKGGPLVKVMMEHYNENDYSGNSDPYETLSLSTSFLTNRINGYPFVNYRKNLIVELESHCSVLFEYDIFLEYIRQICDKIMEYNVNYEFIDEPKLLFSNRKKARISTEKTSGDFLFDMLKTLNFPGFHKPVEEYLNYIFSLIPNKNLNRIYNHHHHRKKKSSSLSSRQNSIIMDLDLMFIRFSRSFFEEMKSAFKELGINRFSKVLCGSGSGIGIGIGSGNGEGGSGSGSVSGRLGFRKLSDVRNIIALFKKYKPDFEEVYPGILKLLKGFRDSLKRVDID